MLNGEKMQLWMTSQPHTHVTGHMETFVRYQKVSSHTVIGTLVEYCLM